MIFELPVQIITIIIIINDFHVLISYNQTISSRCTKTMAMSNAFYCRGKDIIQYTNNHTPNYTGTTSIMEKYLQLIAFLFDLTIPEKKL